MAPLRQRGQWGEQQRFLGVAHPITSRDVEGRRSAASVEEEEEEEVADAAVCGVCDAGYEMSMVNEMARKSGGGHGRRRKMVRETTAAVENDHEFDDGISQFQHILSC